MSTQTKPSYVWQKNLTSLKQKYKAYSKKKISNKQMIQKLNKQLVHADHVLIREMLEKYSNLQQLNKQSTIKEVESFFKSLKENYQTVEDNYLDSFEGEKDQNDQNDREKTEMNLNKTKIQMFIKDENVLFGQIMEQYLENTDQEGEKGVRIGNLNNFLKDLFHSNDHIFIFNNGQFHSNATNYEHQTQSVVKEYFAQAKDNEQQQNLDQQKLYIQQDEILDFLTFWLQYLGNNCKLHVLYARSQNKLNQLKEKYLKQYQQKKNIQKIIVKQQVIQNKPVSNREEVQKSTTDNKMNQNPQNQSQQISNIRKNKAHSVSNTNSFLDSNTNLSRFKYSIQQKNDYLNQKKQLRKSITKEEKLQKYLPEMFTFACKNRVKIHKLTTFDDIEQEKKLMNLEKFINFCNYLEINLLFSRQYLIQTFKTHAINRLHLDFKKFQDLLRKLLRQNQEVINKLLNPQKCSFLRKKTLFNKKLRQATKSLSKYNFELRPVNGKDIQTIQKQLKEKKEQKQLVKRQKEDLLLKKKQGYFNKYQKNLQRQHNQRTINSNSSFLIPSEKSYLESQRILNDKFNPQLLLGYSNEQDKLWQEYESKIWKKDSKNTVNNFNYRNQIANQSILQDALNRRIEKGKKVLKKIASSNLKYYL